MDVAVEVLDLFEHPHRLIVRRKQVLARHNFQEEVADGFPWKAKKLMIVKRFIVAVGDDHKATIYLTEGEYTR